MTERRTVTLPEPECPLGYTVDQLHTILGNRYEEFADWIDGQTTGICDGTRWNPTTKEAEPTGCGPHGGVAYAWDLERFLDGKPIID